MCHLLEYVAHILRFKDGGTEFTSTMSSYDAYMQAIDRRKAVTGARITYLAPLFEWYGREQYARPDYREPPPAPGPQRTQAA